MGDGVLKRDGKYVARPYDPLIGTGRWLGTFKTRKAARQAIAEWRVSRSNPERMKLSVFAVEWLESMKGKVSDRTLADYTTTSNQIAELLGDISLSAITPRSVEQMVSDSVRRFAGNTTRKQVTRLRQMLATAVRWGWLQDNPAKDKVPLPRGKKRIVHPLSPEQAQALINAADDYYKPLLLTALCTGLRWEELFGLRWDDIAFDSSEIHVRQALWEGKLGPLKSEAARRSIKLSPNVLEALRGHQAVCPRTKMNLVFPHPSGRPMAAKTWSDTMIRITKETDTPTIRLHDLRHVYASLLIRSGCSPKLVQSLMGHSTIAVTYDTYGHLFPDEKTKAAEIVGDYFQ